MGSRGLDPDAGLTLQGARAGPASFATPAKLASKTTGAAGPVPRLGPSLMAEQVVVVQLSDA